MSKKKQNRLSTRKRKRDKALVIDLEIACWMGRPPEGMRDDIIEIGVCLYDFETQKIEKPRSILIKPENSEISWFFTKLTSITKDMVEKEGVTFEKAMSILLNEYQCNKRMWFTWGDQDVMAIRKDCRFYKVKYPMHVMHYDARDLYALKFNNSEISLSNAVEELGMEFEGTPHRAISDAVNTARIIESILWD